ncbi:DUF6615 family protein [Streptomyces sp. NPDC057620]|uniref:DUF6615 family protein n=1 Tax=Streptomyces sp. NPDC057620 TaxID=3346185 RepID=UPI0036B39286
MREESLCRTLRDCAERTFERLTSGYLKGIAPGEESFTEFNLQDIKAAHSNQVSIRLFTHQEEALNGADWEWWFFTGNTGFGMRVQAKRAKHNGSYDLRYRINGRLQSDLLIEDAAESECLPVYVFYNHTTWPATRNRADSASTRCSHSSPDQRHLGCTVTSALTVQRTLLQPRTSTAYVRRHSKPWHTVLCDGDSNAIPSLLVPQRRISQLHRKAAEELEHSLSRGDGPLTIHRQLRSQDGTAAAPPAVSRRMDDSKRTSRRKGPSMPPQSPALHTLDRTVYGQLERISQGTIPLPSRIRSMIQEPELTLPPDERAAGAVLINLTPHDDSR